MMCISSRSRMWALESRPVRILISPHLGHLQHPDPKTRPQSNSISSLSITSDKYICIIVRKILTAPKKKHAPMPTPLPEFRPITNTLAMTGPLIMPAVASITAVTVYSLAVWFLCTNDAARDSREGSRPEDNA